MATQKLKFFTSTADVFSYMASEMVMVLEADARDDRSMAKELNHKAADVRSVETEIHQAIANAPSLLEFAKTVALGNTDADDLAQMAHDLMVQLGLASDDEKSEDQQNAEEEARNKAARRAAAK